MVMTASHIHYLSSSSLVFELSLVVVVVVVSGIQINLFRRDVTIVVLSMTGGCCYFDWGFCCVPFGFLFVS